MLLDHQFTSLILWLLYSLYSMEVFFLFKYWSMLPCLSACLLSCASQAVGWTGFVAEKHPQLSKAGIHCSQHHRHLQKPDGLGFCQVGNEWLRAPLHILHQNWNLPIRLKTASSGHAEEPVTWFLACCVTLYFYGGPTGSWERNTCSLCVCRLGDLSCLAEPEDLLAYKDSEVFGAIQDIVMNCTRHRLSLPSHLVENHLCLL